MGASHSVGVCDVTPWSLALLPRAPSACAGECERTRLRLTWGSAAQGAQRSKVLRDAEEVMAERQAELDELEEVRERAVVLMEVARVTHLGAQATGQGAAGGISSQHVA